jgi:hypothetical protein
VRKTRIGIRWRDQRKRREIRKNKKRRRVF